MLSILSSEWLSQSDSNLPQLGAQRALWPPSVAWISFLSVQGHHTPACFYVTHHLAPSLDFAHTHAPTPASSLGSVTSLNGEGTPGSCLQGIGRKMRAASLLQGILRMALKSEAGLPALLSPSLPVVSLVASPGEVRPATKLGLIKASPNPS